MMQLLNKLYLGDLEYLNEYSECVKEYLQGCYDDKLETIKEKEMTNKSKTKFSAGDKVVRTSDYYALYDGGFMQKGNVYTVKDLINDNELLLEGSDIVYSCSYFELFVETPQVDFKNMKFKVSSPEHSKEIQEALFEMGYEWSSYGKQVMFTDGGDTWLITEKTGIIYRTNQDWCNYQEHTVETTKSYKLIPLEIPKPEIITIDGKTYDKEAVLKRLAELEVV